MQTYDSHSKTINDSYSLRDKYHYPQMLIDFSSKLEHCENKFANIYLYKLFYDFNIL